MRFFFAIPAGLLAFLLMLEGVLQVLPVNSGVRMAATGEAAPFSRYLRQQPFVYSHGWALTNHRRGMTNAQGFVNSPDFEQTGGVLVIGDSYIEALMLPWSDTLRGQLARALRGNVLAAAASGNGLADTLQLTRHYAPALQPDTIVIFAKPTELETLLGIPRRGHSSFQLHGREVSLLHAPYQEAASKHLMLQSALLRYGYYNLKFTEWLNTTLARLQGPPPFVLPAQEADNEKVLAWYFAELKKAAPASRIIFLADGDREGIYNGMNNDKSRSIQQHLAVLQREAAAANIEFINMHPVFEQHWKTRHERMDFLPMDGHWNPVGHQLAAQEVLKRLRQKAH